VLLDFPSYPRCCRIIKKERRSPAAVGSPGEPETVELSGDEQEQNMDALDMTMATIHGEHNYSET